MPRSLNTGNEEYLRAISPVESFAELIKLSQWEVSSLKVGSSCLLIS